VRAYVAGEDIDDSCLLDPDSAAQAVSAAMDRTGKGSKAAVKSVVKNTAVCSILILQPRLSVQQWIALEAN
jgi:hypothetical protein